MDEDDEAIYLLPDEVRIRNKGENYKEIFMSVNSIKNSYFSS